MSSRKTGAVKYWCLVWLFVGLGAILRLWQYLANRSIWGDEASLAINIISKSFKGLLGQLDFNSASPIGFLFIEKAAVNLLGASDYALRLWPLIAGLFALIIFPFVARRCCGSRASLIAVALFAVSDRLIYYSSEVKTYSSDMAIMLAIFLAVLSMEKDGSWKRKLILLAVIGAVSVWISHLVLFTFPAALIVGALLIRERKSTKFFTWFIVSCVIWLVSVALFYLVSLPQLPAIQYAVEFWRFSMAPFPFSSRIDFEWYFKTLPLLMQNPGGFSFRGLAYFSALIGALSMVLDKKSKKLILLLGPVLSVFVASGFNRFPIYGRFMLFAVPSALILIAEGADAFMRAPSRLMKTGGVILLCLLVVYPLRVTVKSFSQPRCGDCGPSEIRPVLEYLTARREPGDVIYVHHGAVTVWKYYTYGQDIIFIEGTRSYDSSQKYIDEIESLRGSPRIWFIFGRVWGGGWLGIDEGRFFVDYLNQIGELKDSYKSPGASAYLYDLSEH